MRTILLVEAELSHLRRLERWIESDISKHYDVKILVATNYEEGQRWIKKNHIDVPIFDISLMGDDDELGLELARLYRKKYKYNTVFFQTAKNDPLYQNNIHNEIGSVIYLTKKDLIKDTFISKLRHELERLEQAFVGVHFIKQRHKMIKIEPNRTLYFEKINREHLVKHCYYDAQTDEVYTEMLTSMSLNKIESLLDATVYLRTHQSFIVNRNMIAEVETKGSSHMTQMKHAEIEIPISRGFLKKVEAYLQALPTRT